MNNTVRQILSGFTAGVIVGGTAIVAMLVDVPLEDVTGGQWVTIGIGGLLASAKDWKTLLAPPRI